MKKKYSDLQNIIFTHRYLLKGCQVRYWLSVLVIILGSIGSTFLLTYFPAYVVELLLGGGRVGGIFLRVAAYSALLCAVTVVYKRMERSSGQMLSNRRMRKGQEFYVEILKADYENIDNSKYKALFDAGLDSYYDGFHEGFHHIIIDFRTLLASVTGLLVYIVMIAGIDIWISIFLLIVSGFSIFANGYYEKWVRNHQEQWQHLDTKLKYLTRESISQGNAKDIRLYHLKDWFADTFGLLTRTRLDWYKKELRTLYLINLAERFLTAVKYLAAYLVVFAKVKNGLEVSYFILFIGLILGVNQWVAGIFESVKYLQTNCIHVENTRKVLDMGVDRAEGRTDGTEDRAKPDKSGAPASSPIEIRLEDVSFTFPEGKAPILEHFNLTIKAGEKLAIVGSNGAGKSTLIKLICGLYRPDSGKILLNGQDIGKWTREEVYEKFAVVFQDFNLLAVSIAENVSCRPMDGTDVDRVQRCLHLAGLKEKVDSLPKGVKSNLLRELDSEGIVLSGGEKQKLLIARCLYKDSPVMVLDEPTSALDAIAESEIYGKYNDLTRGKTSIFISHRLSSTKFCDRIIMMDRGKIVEEGTHEELLGRNGEYAKMYSIQSSYYNEEPNRERETF